MTTRRQVLTTGAASIAIFGLGLGGCALLPRNIDAVREPWRRTSAGFGDPRLDALAYAILAPNPHNRQPWQVQLEGEDRFTLFCDLNRLLPQTDPQNRQIVVGLGAFLELFRQAAVQKNFAVTIDHFPEGYSDVGLDERPIASVRMEHGGRVSGDPLFGTILKRRTMRVPFEARSVSNDMLAKLSEMALGPLESNGSSFQFDTSADGIGWHKNIHRRGWNLELETSHAHKETVSLTRIGAEEVKANPDGISLHGSMVETARMLGLLTRKKMNTPGSTAFEETRKFYIELIDTAQAFGWLSSPTNGRIDQLKSGAAWVRLNLAATELGLAMHPLSQVLQEFPEMMPLYDEFHHHLKIVAPSRVQGLFRFGYADALPASPRWPLESRLISA